MRDIRNLEPEPLAEKLYKLLSEESETFDSEDRFLVHQQNRWYLHRMLARITNYIETQSGMPSRYFEYVHDRGKQRYEVEHIWADKFNQFKNEFSHPVDFADYRNKIGGLLLLPKPFNASFGALSYKKKLPHYYAQNLLARSLNNKCYKRNPGFLKFIKASSLPFKPYTNFNKSDLDERQELIKEIAKQIWNPERLHTMIS